MPQASSETYRLAAHVLGVDDDTEMEMEGLKYLKARNWLVTRGGLLHPPSVKPPQDEMMVAWYLFEEWDYGITKS